MRFDLTVNEFTRDLFLKNNIIIYDANTWRPYCHVNDFARLINIVLESEKKKVNFEIFNAGGDKNNSTKLGITERLKKYFPKLTLSFKDKGNDPRNYRVNFSKVKRVLGFEPKYTIDDGIKEIVVSLKKGKFIDRNKYSDYLGNYKINT
jgi:nucleoside-diphosphate-sugar epimerase